MNSSDLSENTNRLIDEQSPYLLQHAYNPVDWYPWGEEAFEAARQQDKPIFLSIGYSTCHWCHVMERESFENEEIATLMNDTYINIKVDREERPDIDSIYMTVCQLLTGGGGWPLTVVMTPNRRPFFAGTYFPPESMPGRIGVREMAQRIKALWESRRNELLESATKITDRLRQENGREIYQLDERHLNEAFTELQRTYDSERGGFNGAPKFPSPQNFRFLLRHSHRTGRTEGMEITAESILKMRNGGIFDQIGGGFHRYSTDRKWLVPHFEKMLYDQAWMMIACAETYQATRDERFAGIINDIDEYVSRDLRFDLGGFYCAEDADSEGVEGKFYTWFADDIRKILGDDADFAIKYYNIKDEGNFIGESAMGASNLNILHRVHSLDNIAADFNLTAKEAAEKIQKINKKLFEKREKRIRPGLDDKALTDWNSMMIAAYAIAGRATGNPKYTEKAEAAYDFITNNLRSKDGLLHRWRHGKAGIEAVLDDYAFLIFALIELYEATYLIGYLKDAVTLAKEMNDKFLDRKKGGYFNSSSDAADLIARRKDVYDGATPSANSINISNMLRLSRMTGRTKFENIARDSAGHFSAMVKNYPAGFAEFLCGIDFMIGQAKEVVVSGKKKECEAMTIPLREEFLPRCVVIMRDADNPEISGIAGYTREQEPVDGKPTAYVCSNFSCRRPVTSAEEMMILIKE